MVKKNDLCERLLKSAVDAKVNEYLVTESSERKLILASIMNKL